MKRSGKMQWLRCAFALAVSLVCVAPGGAAPFEHSRGGTSSECCDVTGTYDLRFTVKIDPANHHAVLQLRDGRLVIARLSDDSYEVRGNRPPIIRATFDSLSLCTFPLANGVGTVAGFPNVTGRYKNVEVTGDDIRGLLELGVGGELPTGQPICYEFTGQRDPSVPDSGAAEVDLAVKFTLSLVKGAPANPVPGFFFGFGRGNTVGAGFGKFVYKPDGTGGFFPAGELPLSANHEPIASVALGRPGTDVQDIAIISRDQASGDAELNYFMQTVTGTFDRRQTLSLDASYDNGDAFIGAGDLNGDGTPEIVTASRTGRIDVLRYDRDAFTTLRILEAARPIALLPQFADVDGDGASDVVVVSPADMQSNEAQVQVLLGDGAGGLTPGPTTSVPYCLDTPFVDPFALADVNDDEFLDAVFGGLGGPCPTPNATPFVVVLLNRADQPGTFVPQTPFEVPAAAGTFSLALWKPPCAGALAVIANGGVFLGMGDGSFVDSGVRYSLDGVPPLAFHAGDDHCLTGIYFQNDLLTIQTRSLEPLVERPVISNVSVAGKTLVVEGSGFSTGSKILVDGVVYKTKADRATPSTTVFSKKALKKIPAGTPVTVQVQRPDGVVSEGITFQR